MIDLILPLVISIIVFSLGCLMVYKLIKDKEGWDKSWENENQQRPLAPKNWAGSDESKALTYLFAFIFLVGGFFVMLSSIFNLIMYIK